MRIDHSPSCFVEVADKRPWNKTGVERRFPEERSSTDAAHGTHTYTHIE